MALRPVEKRQRVVVARPPVHLVDPWRPCVHSRTHFGYEFAKRVCDITLGGALLIALLPVALLAAAAVALSTRANPIYVQKRLGHLGREITVIKIRTMCPGADQLVPFALNETDGPTFKARNDPRVTTVGHWLRKFSIDELPQLLSVVAGTMSLVGPRPPFAREVAAYRPSQRHRLCVKPGLTGLWQVSGRSDIPFPKWMALDRLYVQKRSLLLDGWLIVMTPLAILTARGAR